MTLRRHPDEAMSYGVYRAMVEQRDEARIEVERLSRKLAAVERNRSTDEDCYEAEIKQLRDLLRRVYPLIQRRDLADEVEQAALDVGRVT